MELTLQDTLFGASLSWAALSWLFTVARALRCPYLQLFRACAQNELLAPAAALQEARPEMPIGEVIADSGFGSRNTYYRLSGNCWPRTGSR